ncbi:MAG: hypothetical protein ABIJ81_00475 [Patescibacteria group bacterium]
MTLGGFILGLIISFIGFLLVWKSEWLMVNFGRIPWAEEHLGAEGGSRIFFKLLGILIIILGFGIMTNIWQPIMQAAFSPFFSGLAQ